MKYLEEQGPEDFKLYTKVATKLCNFDSITD